MIFPLSTHQFNQLLFVCNYINDIWVGYMKEKYNNNLPSTLPSKTIIKNRISQLKAKLKKSAYGSVVNGWFLSEHTEAVRQSDHIVAYVALFSLYLWSCQKLLYCNFLGEIVDAECVADRKCISSVNYYFHIFFVLGVAVRCIRLLLLLILLFLWLFGDECISSSVTRVIM